MSRHIGLTRNNFHGGHLHQNIRGRAVQDTGTDVNSHSPTNLKMTSLTEAEIYALPESSDEEEILTTPKNSARTSNGTKRKREDETSPASNKVRVSGKATRQSQRNQSSNLPRESSPQSITLPDPDIDWSRGSQSQSSQSRRKNQTYSKHDQHSTLAKPASQSRGRITVPDDPVAVHVGRPGVSEVKAVLKVMKSPSKPKRQSRKESIKQPPPDASQKSKPIATFRIPEDISPEQKSSSDSFSTDIPKIFDIDDTLAAPFDKRRGSTSSLSSVDSIASVFLSQSQKDDLKNGTNTSENLPPGTFRCPLCSELVHHSKTNTKINPSKLSLRAQQEYCHKHKTHDAQLTWEKLQYPQINWTDLETRRIPSHIPYLRGVLYNKTPSYYLSTLETKINGAKGNKRKINAYLLDGILDVAKPGYYGAKGAKVMSQAISSLLAKHLKMKLTSDKMVATAGVAGYISAVLLPEICQRLIMEDLAIEDENEARRVMGESSDVGLLLWPDDDHVDLDEDDLSD